ncbi:MAG: multidrug effflux MFS transporter [Thalassobaculaceae bacterium]|nr:multidrug effflux MFS transporter [Thalassobaculaceae bacterium]
MATRPGSIALLTFMVALGQMSLGLYLPSLPSLAHSIGATRAEAQLTLTVFLGGFAVSQLFWGPLADRLGRRITLLIGLVIYAAAGLACAQADTIHELIVFRFFQALGACSGQVVARAMVRDSTEGAATAVVMSYIAMSMSLAPAITPALGGFLETHFGWRANFVALGAIGATLFTLTLLRVPETLQTRVYDALSPFRIVRNYGTLLGDRTYVCYIVTVGGSFGAYMAYTTATPFVLMEMLGWTPQTFGFLILFNVVAFLSGSILAGRLAPIYGPRRMARIGATICFAGGVAMIASPLVGHLSTPAVIGPAMLLLVGMAFAIPNAMAGAMQNFPYIAGSASAFLGFSQMAQAMIASFVVGAIGGNIHLTMAGATLACTVASLTAALLLPRPVQTQPMPVPTPADTAANQVDSAAP